MVEGLIAGWEARQEYLVREWRQRFQVNSRSQGKEGLPLLVLIPDFCRYVLDSAAGKKPPRVEVHPPSGPRIWNKLPQLAEVLLTGEETFRDDLFLDDPQRPPFSDHEHISHFEEIHHLFHKLIRQQVATFCDECVKPLASQSHRLFENINAPRNKNPPAPAERRTTPTGATHCSFSTAFSEKRIKH